MIQTTAKEIFIRIALVAISVSAATLFIKNLIGNDNLKWLDIMEISNAEVAEAANDWLDEKIGTAKNIASNTSIIQATTLKDYNSVKKELNEIAYQNEIDNIYIYSNKTAAISAKTSGSPKPPLHVLKILNDTASARQEELVTTFIYEGKTQLLTAAAIFNNLGNIIGYSTFFEPIDKALGPLKAAPDEFRIFEMSLVKLSKNGHYGFLRNFTRVVGELESFPPANFYLPLFDKNTFAEILNDNLGDEILAVGYVLDKYPSWQIVTTVDTDKIPRETDNLTNIVIALTGFVVIMLLLLPTKGGYSNILRKSYKKAEKILEKGPAKIDNEEEQSNDIKLSRSAPKINPEQAEKNKDFFEGKKKKILQEGTPTSAEISFDIRSGMKNKRFKLLYQPVVDPISNKVIMHEVYMRIIDEEGNVIEPNLWLPVAQKENLFSLIDESVLNYAIETHFNEKTNLAVPLAFNISGDTFDSFSYIETLMNKVTNNDNITGKTIFELHSKELVKDSKTINFIKECREMGFRFSIDYFGGGAKTVELTKKLRFSFLKVDALKFNVKNKEDLKELITIIKTAEVCGIKVIIEKVEDEAMVEFCRKLKYPYMQGYHVEKPRHKPILELE